MTKNVIIFVVIKLFTSTVPLNVAVELNVAAPVKVEVVLNVAAPPIVVVELNVTEPEIVPPAVVKQVPQLTTVAPVVGETEIGPAPVTEETAPPEEGHNCQADPS